MTLNGDDVDTGPIFESQFRGYDRKQVERYVARAEDEITALAAERQMAFDQIRRLSLEVDRLTAELAAQRRGAPPQG